MVHFFGPPSRFPKHVKTFDNQLAVLNLQRHEGANVRFCAFLFVVPIRDTMREPLDIDRLIGPSAHEPLISSKMLVGVPLTGLSLDYLSPEIHVSTTVSATTRPESPVESRTLSVPGLPYAAGSTQT